MSGKTSRTKGARIERELVNLLKERLGDGVERNLNQTRDGGADVLINGVAIESKGGKQFQRAWLDQTWEQAMDAKSIPLLAWRLHGGGWRFFREMDFDEVVEMIRRNALYELTSLDQEMGRQ